MSKIGIALAGYGTIGSGAIEILQNNNELITKRAGIEIELKYVIDKDWTTPRRIDIKSAQKITDYKIALEDPSVDIIVELVGGVNFAYTLIEDSLKAGKNVVTANKALLAEKGAPLFNLAGKVSKNIGFEASVCGGIPIIRTISDALIGDNIKSLYGIVNGTTNYILTKMVEENMDFDSGLKQAQKLGFAEADPTLDIEGHDAAHKAAILAAISFNTDIDYRLVYTEGITNIDLEDINNAEELGYIIKLLAISKLDPDNSVEVRVNPTLVPFDNQLASVRNEFNAILIESEYLGNSMYFGKGAGSRPTAVSVISDIVDMAKFIEDTQKTSKFKNFNRYSIKNIGDIVTRYYVRFVVLDKPGVLSKISGIFSNFSISIASVIQKERKENDFVPLIMTTHEAQEKNLISALGEIEKEGLTKQKPVMIRILE